MPPVGAPGAPRPPYVQPPNRYAVPGPPPGAIPVGSRPPYGGPPPGPQGVGPPPMMGGVPPPGAPGLPPGGPRPQQGQMVNLPHRQSPGKEGVLLSN